MDNLDRNVWCLLGLPFDPINLETTVDKVHEAAENKTPCFISTPNLNFLIASQKDEKFRDSVINSDISIADGKPLVWISKLLGIPIPERVAGSDLIETLIENNKNYKPLNIFFFGGEDGVAQQACEKLNAQNKGLRCVGFYNPGFGSVEDMSSTEIVDEINQSNADFIIVSLGAKKGQAWIEHNRNKLNAALISHLGAVVNFIAGNVSRAPKLLQRLGLEWLWRIKEEPSLWRRYINDGLVLIYLLFFKILPLFFIIRKNKNHSIENKTRVSKNNNSIVISCHGYYGLLNILEINNIFRDAVDSSLNIIVVISDGSYIDGCFLGEIIKVKKHLSKHEKTIFIESKAPLINKIISYNCCDYLVYKDSNKL